MNSSASVDAKRFRESLHILINRDQSKSAVVEMEISPISHGHGGVFDDKIL